MKNSKLLLIYSIANLLGIFIFTLVLPSTVIFKVNSQFVVEQLIGKWYNIILPILAIIACAIILSFDVKENDERKHYYRYIVAFIAVTICSYFSWILIGMQYVGAEIGEKVVFPWSIAVLFPIAYFMLITGVGQFNKEFNAPSLFGFEWVKVNTLVWDKTHSFAGKLSIITAILLFAVAVLNVTWIKSNWVYVIAFAIWFLVYFMIITIYSKVISNKYSCEDDEIADENE